MANRLWEYRTTSDLGKNTLAWCHSNGIFQAMCTNSSGELLLHIIDETDTTPDIKSIIPGAAEANIICIEMDLPFSILPAAFQQVQIPGMATKQHTKKLDEALFLAFQANKNDSAHVAATAYTEGKKRAAQREHYQLVFVHGKSCFIFYFINGDCQMANIFPASNESEVLYYCMAILKKEGTDIRKVHFDILGNNIKEIIAVFDRFGGGARPFQMQLPYAVGEYPPYAAESYLLYQFLTCELPVAH